MKQMYYLTGGLVVVTVVCFLLVSCNKNEDIEKADDEKLSVDKTELSFMQKDESKNFYVSIDDTKEWYLEADGLERYFGPNMADVRDFTIEPVSGKGKTEISVTLRNEPAESYIVDLKIVETNNQVIVKLRANAN
jgi:hypothetical protein